MLAYSDRQIASENYGGWGGTLPGRRPENLNHRDAALPP